MELMKRFSLKLMKIQQEINNNSEYRCIFYVNINNNTFQESN